MESEKISAESSGEAKKATQRIEKKKILLFNVISFVIVFLALGWAIATYFHLGKQVFTDDAQVESYVSPVNVRIQGYIHLIRFKEHQRVKKGDTLVIIDDREYRIQVKQAEAAVLYATAGKSVVNVTENGAENGIAVSDANIEEVKARLDNAELNFRRYASLLQEDVVTKFQFDQQKADRDALRAKYQSLLHSKTGAQINTSETGKKIDVAKADIERANAALNYSRLNLSYTVITAPYDGVVGRKIIEEGQYVQPGQTMVSIVRSGERWINANYTESQMMALSPGEKVRIHVDAFKGKDFYGKITAISAATGSRYSAIPVDNSTGNFVKVQQRVPVRIDFTNATSNDLDKLRAGMNAEVELIK